MAFALLAPFLAVEQPARGGELPAGCSPADAESCLYASDFDFPVATLDGLSLTDQERGVTVPFLVRHPIGATGPLPIVIWNHGGGPSPRADLRSAEWGRTLARAGYVVIHPARPFPSNLTPWRSECTANGLPRAADCGEWVAQHRIGPGNPGFLLDHINEIQALLPDLPASLDEERVAIAGHSTGTVTVLMNAGAVQRFVDGGTVYSNPEPRARAFLASGPIGPTYAGFLAGFQDGHFFEGIDRPFLFLTGFGDEQAEPAETRAAAFLHSAAGDKYLSWDTEAEAVHETMNIHECDTAVRKDHCRWIAAAGLAFLDAKLRGRAAAIEWLASDALEVLSDSSIELHRR